MSTLPLLLPTLSPVKIVIDKLFIAESESDIEKFIYQVKKSEDFSTNKEIMGGNIEESSTLSPLEVIFVTTEFTDVFRENSTQFLPEVTTVTMEFDDVLSEDLSGKLPPMHNIQDVVDLIPGPSLPNFPHPSLNPTEQTKCKRQVDELSLAVKQQCIVPSDVHFYEDKFWSYIVTKNVGIFKDIIIYDRSISKIFEHEVMREYNALQIIDCTHLLHYSLLHFHIYRVINLLIFLS